MLKLASSVFQTIRYSPLFHRKRMVLVGSGSPLSQAFSQKFSSKFKICSQEFSKNGPIDSLLIFNDCPSDKQIKVSFDEDENILSSKIEQIFKKSEQRFSEQAEALNEMQSYLQKKATVFIIAPLEAFQGGSIEQLPAAQSLHLAMSLAPTHSRRDEFKFVCVLFESGEAEEKLFREKLIDLIGNWHRGAPLPESGSCVKVSIKDGDLDLAYI